MDPNSPLMTKKVNAQLWFHRLLRWCLGVLFIFIGIAYGLEEAWPSILFGSVLLVTGFLRPRRCLEEDSCPTNRR